MLLAVLLLAAAAKADHPAASPTPLGDCMGGHVEEADKPVLAHWYALEIAASAPADGASVDAAKREAAAKEAARVFTRMVAKDCLATAKPLFAADSQAAFREAGVAFSRLAARELLATNGVNPGIVRSYVSQLSREDFAPVLP